MAEIGRVLIAYPRGFCAGVRTALDIFYGELEHRERSGNNGVVYGYHQIVHNRPVIDGLKRRGVIFADDVEVIPYYSTVVFSAHGVSPEVRKKAEERRLDIIDTTCPLVEKVHREVRIFASSGYQVVLIGEDGHDEVVGVRGEAPDRTWIVGDIKDVGNLPDWNRNVAYVTQTTLNVDSCMGMINTLKGRYPFIIGPSKGNMCYATKNRQDAIRGIASDYHPHQDLFLIIGSVNSSNTKKLVEVATLCGVESYRVDNISEVDSSLFENRRVIGISSGASVPEERIREATNYFTQLGVPISEIRVAEERTTFPIPEKIRKRWSNI